MSLPRNLAAALRRFPLDQKRVLEPACGKGRYLTHFGPGSVGLDHNAEVVAAFNAELGRPQSIRHVDLDAPDWNAGLAGFEAAYVCDVLMHVADPAAFLRNLATTLAPGAPVFVVEWVLPGGALANALARRVPGARDVFTWPEHLRVFIRAELEDLVETCGYRTLGRWLHTFDARAPWLAPCVKRFWPVATWHLVCGRSRDPEIPERSGTQPTPTG